MTCPRAPCWALPVVICLLALVARLAAGAELVAFNPTETIQFTKVGWGGSLPHTDVPDCC